MIKSFRQPNSQKFFLRQILRTDYCNHHYLVSQGHVFSLSGSFLNALSCYGRAWTLCHDDPSLNLFVGLTILHRAAQRNSNNRHAQIIQGLSFLHSYRRANKSDSTLKSQECLYNIGRAYHMFGIYHLAVAFYKHALALDCQLNENDLSQSLSFEAAYNLSRIYIEAGAASLGAVLLYRYCSV